MMQAKKNQKAAGATSPAQFSWSMKVSPDQIDFMKSGKVPAGCDCNCGYIRRSVEKDSAAQGTPRG